MSNKMHIDNLVNEVNSVKEALHNLSAVASFTQQPEDLNGVTEKLNEALEKATVLSRNTLEHFRTNIELPKRVSPELHNIEIAGSVRVIEYNWLHIQLNTLLPHCRFQTPLYLSDTIVRLLDYYQSQKGQIPYYKNALLIIDEHCDIKSRTVFDQDNKGWKAVSNALKGRVFPDDDQFSVGIALMSSESKKTMCNIFIIDATDAGEFFNARLGGSLYW